MILNRANFIQISSTLKFDKLYSLLPKSTDYNKVINGRGQISRDITTTGHLYSARQAYPKSDFTDVIFKTVNYKGIITLNRPTALNVLNLSMIRKIYPQLRAWEATQDFVIIKGNGGKAFCAGGDIRAVTGSVIDEQAMYKDIFREKFKLYALIATLRIPYISLIDGITMGGGVGLSIHGKYRVATERTLFAMPETRIGLFPYVGGSYLLPQLRGKLGLYLALTGYRLKGSDVFKAGVATHLCTSSQLPELEHELISLKSAQAPDIEAVLLKYHNQCPESRKQFTLEMHMDKINDTFRGTTIEEIVDNLRTKNCYWSKETLHILSQMSPTSLKISLKLLQMRGALDVQEALKYEYRLSQRCCENHDFIEGIRALIFDKDYNTQWKPKTVEEVTLEIVESYFAPLPETEELTV